MTSNTQMKSLTAFDASGDSLGFNPRIVVLVEVQSLIWASSLFVFRKLILQTHMRSHPVGLDVSFLVGLFV